MFRKTVQLKNSILAEILMSALSKQWRNYQYVFYLNFDVSL